jgi:hypothetical protein
MVEAAPLATSNAIAPHASTGTAPRRGESGTRSVSACRARQAKRLLERGSSWRSGSRPRVLAASKQASDGGHHLRGALVALVLTGLDHAVAGVVVEQAERNLVQRGLRGADLGEHVDAVAVLFDHPLDSLDLAADPAQSDLELVLADDVSGRGRGVHGGCIMAYPQGVCYGEPVRRLIEGASPEHLDKDPAPERAP